MNPLMIRTISEYASLFRFRLSSISLSDAYSKFAYHIVEIILTNTEILEKRMLNVKTQLIVAGCFNLCEERDAFVAGLKNPRIRVSLENYI